MPKTKIMGIINVTPDSFFAESRHPQTEEAIQTGLRLIHEGADLLDIGGESTRPYAEDVDEVTEMERVIPVIETLNAKTKIKLSIDTKKPNVAKAAVKAGATLINDVSGFRDEKMVEIATDTAVEICVTHMQGTPQTMQNDPRYEDGIMTHLLQWFEKRINDLVKLGVKESKIMIDPGIGFGKAVADNFKILDNLLKLKTMGFPVLLGVSRKSFISKTLNKPTADLLAATLAINALATLSRIDIIRVHDVKEHRDLINILTPLERLKEPNTSF